MQTNVAHASCRNVRVDSMDTLDRAMNVIKTKGFINYYGTLLYSSTFLCEPESHV